MEQAVEKPKSLEEAFSLLEKGATIEVDTMDAIRIFQSTQTSVYRVYFNMPVQGKTILIPS